tara:strand:- start:59390 stop:60658 length:1269 start_codon:yes stop_codon:yes gene_type:complete
MDLLEPVVSLGKWFLGKAKDTDSVEKFENELASYLFLDSIKCLSHARICLYYALKSYENQEGDEILMTPINLPDMVNMIRILGLKERFVDIKRSDYSIDLVDAKNKLSEKSKFLFVTHLNGFIPNMNEIEKFASDHNLILIQDTTQNFGAKYNGMPLESFGEHSFFSLCDLKVLHTHMGGALVSNVKERKIKVEELTSNELKSLRFSYLRKFLVEDLIANLILNRIFFNFFVFPVLKLITFYVGSQNIQDLTNGKGVKFGKVVFLKGLFGGGGDVLSEEVPADMLYKYSSLQAEIGLKRLSYLERVEKRRIYFAKLCESKLTIPEKNRFKRSEQEHVFWKFPVYCEDWITLQKYLMDRGIDSARSNLPCLSDLDYLKSSDKTPVAQALVKNSIYIPLHFYLKDDEIEFVIDAVNKYFEGGGE